jgi:hypothetical protein
MFKNKSTYDSKAQITKQINDLVVTSFGIRKTDPSHQTFLYIFSIIKLILVHRGKVLLKVTKPVKIEVILSQPIPKIIK